MDPVQGWENFLSSKFGWSLVVNITENGKVLAEEFRGAVREALAEWDGLV